MRRKDYQRKIFHNPYFGRRKQGSGWGKRIILALFSLFLLIIAVRWAGDAFGGGGALQIEIVGAQPTHEQTIRELISQQFEKNRFGIFSQRQLLFFSKRQALRTIEQSLTVENIKITKDYPATIAVAVQEKTSTLVWVTGGKQYYLGNEGQVIREVELSDITVAAGEEQTQIIRVGKAGDQIPVVYDQESRTLEPGQLFVHKELVDFILLLQAGIMSGTDLDVSHYTIDRLNSDQLTMVTTQGWYVIFRTTDSANDQIARLALLLQNKITDRDQLEYIDLRFGEKTFFK